MEKSILDLYRFDFEKPIAQREQRLFELRQSSDISADEKKQIKEIEREVQALKQDIYGNLTAWQRVQLARHPLRPYALDYIHAMAPDFIPIHGDRLFSDDRAMIGGVGSIDGHSCMFIGHQKGRDTKENLMRNFGSAHPEGYRKALRLMHLAEKFHLPIFVLVDTPGAYPGIGAEERGQAHSIAYNIREMARIKTPIYIVVIGEGGSGGALGVGLGDWAAMLENAYYSVISPEGCAAILWRDRAMAPDAAAALRLNSKDLVEFGIVDESIAEPLGGAHHDYDMVVERMRASFLKFLKLTTPMPVEELLNRRYERVRRIGEFNENPEQVVSA